MVQVQHRSMDNNGRVLRRLCCVEANSGASAVITRMPGPLGHGGIPDDRDDRRFTAGLGAANAALRINH
jgi:hypothetical protein